jgi:glycosyltransferase involved in cell wall biosynthesis
VERGAVTRIGVVAIGRNEGERLLRCLDSARAGGRTLVYVDSGSSDGSAAAARARGAAVVELDARMPFTAARARNAGFARLLELDPQVEWVQFVDGDCELAPEWWSAVAGWLPGDPAVAVICGRRRERHPESSVYNRLCDLEWDTPVGSALACGGDALMRVSALRAVGGFAPGLIAGEEPELCFRLRAAGHRIERIAAEMTLHDAALTRFAQWWRRALRAGHAYAENHALHGASAERFKARELRSVLLWGGALPALAFGLAPASAGLSLAALGAYGVLFARVRAGQLRAGRSAGDAARYAAFVVIGKWAQLAGVAWFWWNRAFGRRAALIEYKRPA